MGLGNMVSTASASVAVSRKSQVEENLLTPRFYTTDFDKAAGLDLSAGEVNLEIGRASCRERV